MANVVEKDLRLVNTGDPATVEVDAYPGDLFKGHIARVSPVLDPATRTATMEVEIPNRDNRLKPGMYARVLLTIEERKGTHARAEDRGGGLRRQAWRLDSGRREQGAVPRDASSGSRIRNGSRSSTASSPVTASSPKAQARCAPATPWSARTECRRAWCRRAGRRPARRPGGTGACRRPARAAPARRRRRHRAPAPGAQRPPRQ